MEALFRLWTAEPLDQAAASASAIDISKWRTFQTALFLDRLLDGSPLPQGGCRGCRAAGRGGAGCLRPDALHPAEVVTSLSQCYSSLLDSMNAEIRIRWLQIVVRNDYYPDLHRVRRFLESQVGPLPGARRADGASRRAGRGGRGSGARAPGESPATRVQRGRAESGGAARPALGLWALGLRAWAPACLSPGARGSPASAPCPTSAPCPGPLERGPAEGPRGGAGRAAPGCSRGGAA